MNATSELKKKVFIRFIMAPIFIGLILFLPAGTLDYWQAWIYCGVLFIPMFLVVFYFLKKDPELLERRMRVREKEEKQKTIIKIGYLFTPIALGSYWAIIFFLPLIPLIVVRLLNEEEVLLKELPGYKEYCQKTRYHLVPFIW